MRHVDLLGFPINRSITDSTIFIFVHGFLPLTNEHSDARKEPLVGVSFDEIIEPLGSRILGQ
jgi:hypothetical protein